MNDLLPADDCLQLLAEGICRKAPGTSATYGVPFRVVCLFVFAVRLLSIGRRRAPVSRNFTLPTAASPTFRVFSLRRSQDQYLL